VTAVPVLIDPVPVTLGRVTVWRLECSECGRLTPPVRAKSFIHAVAEQHSREKHLGRVFRVLTVRRG